MSKTTDFKELTKIYLDVSQDYLSYDDVSEQWKKSNEELAKIVPDERLRDDITDCFGMSLDMYQRQGFIRGFQFATRLFLEAHDTICKRGVKLCRKSK